MNRKNLSFVKNTRFLYSLLFLFFILINSLTPYNGDDYTYEFNFADHTRITNVLDVLESQYVHYLTANGRTIPHLFEQFFAGITGKWLFNILNSLMMIFLIKLVSRILFRITPFLTKHKLSTITIVFLSLLFLFSYPGQSMLWMAGGLNYLWPTVFTLIVWILFDSPKKYNVYLIGFCSILCAWCQEAISIPFCASMWLMLFLYKNTRNKKNLFIVIGYTIGMCLIVFSPGTMGRLASDELKVGGDIFQVIVSKFLETIACLRGLYIYWITLVLLIVMCFVKRIRQSCVKERFFQELLIIWIINTLFFLALGFPSERITLFLSLVSFLISIFILGHVSILQRCIQAKYMPLVLVVLTLISCYYVANVCMTYRIWNNHMRSLIEDNPQERLVLNLDSYTNQSRFIYAELLNKHADSGHNKGFSLYFGKKSIQFLDSKLYNLIYNIAPESKIIRTYSSIDDEYVLYETDDFYYVKLPVAYFDEGIKVKGIHTTDNENLLKRQKVIRGLLGTLDDGISNIEHCLVFENEKECGCYIPRFSSKENSLAVFNKLDKSQICVFILE